MSDDVRTVSVRVECGDGAGDIFFVPPEECGSGKEVRSLWLVDAQGLRYRGRVFVDQFGRLEWIELHGGDSSTVVSDGTEALRVPARWG